MIMSQDFVGRGVMIDVCETERRKSYDACVLKSQTHSGIRKSVSEYCVVECVRCAFLC